MIKQLSQTSFHILNLVFWYLVQLKLRSPCCELVDIDLALQIAHYYHVNNVRVRGQLAAKHLPGEVHVHEPHHILGSSERLVTLHRCIIEPHHHVAAVDPLPVAVQLQDAELPTTAQLRLARPWASSADCRLHPGFVMECTEARFTKPFK
eukprot:CAMPEP_0178416332 /NCGR_PEP_ID=MMETSP0689_2-20121128/24010_1 /TAXON_ID=160604 /ORGANISM="Amphidinium massartii, Strain CS-259" /LENGTH=149 /DNA_ID=CAMNT_0020037675 /DNA_START=221 /DNA_END=671 /DNA_ORIENTATION=+